MFGKNMNEKGHSLLFDWFSDVLNSTFLNNDIYCSSSHMSDCHYPQFFLSKYLSNFGIWVIGKVKFVSIAAHAQVEMSGRIDPNRLGCTPQSIQTNYY